VKQAVDEALKKRTDLKLKNRNGYRVNSKRGMLLGKEETFVVKVADEEKQQLTTPSNGKIKIRCLGNDKFEFVPKESEWKVDANVRGLNLGESESDGNNSVSACIF
jgi:hypothetical protein